MSLGWVVALPREGRTLTPRVPAMGTVGALPGGHRLAVSGMGALASTRAAALLQAAGVHGLISWGSCGGLSPLLSPGTIIIADRVMDEDGRGYSADAVLHRWACQVAPDLTVQSGTLISATQVVATTAAKRALFAQTMACGVDMESAAVGRYATDHGLAFLAIRAIVDPAWVSLPASVLTAIDGHGRVRAGRLARLLVSRWQTVGELLALARYFGCAAQSLAALAPRLLVAEGTALTDLNRRKDCVDEGPSQY